MLAMGDELVRTQDGNNNAYCQDNATGWVDWSLAETERDMVEFVARLCRFRLAHPACTAVGSSPRKISRGYGPTGEPMGGEDSDSAVRPRGDGGSGFRPAGPDAERLVGTARLQLPARSLPASCSRL